MTSAHAGNYTPGRLEPIRYLVLHYTAGRNDSAGSNLRYFRDNVVKASAHYFVDEKLKVFQKVGQKTSFLFVYGV